jgi:hypothetical protein
MRLSSSTGRPSMPKSRVKAATPAGTGLPASTSDSTLSLDCASTMRPERNASGRPSRLSLDTFFSADRKLVSRASSSGTAQGSARWSGPPVRPSSPRIRRDQSSAPTSTQAACTRARSAASISVARHCCQSAAAEKVATSITVSMAASRAAPAWRARLAVFWPS